jgi:hypothetical protein
VGKIPGGALHGNSITLADLVEPLWDSTAHPQGNRNLSDKLENIVAAYFPDLRDKRGLGAGTPERSYYTAVSKLLDSIGEKLKPKVLCLSDLSNTGADTRILGSTLPTKSRKANPARAKRPNGA